MKRDSAGALDFSSSRGRNIYTSESRRSCLDEQHVRVFGKVSVQQGAVVLVNDAPARASRRTCRDCRSGKGCCWPIIRPAWRSPEMAEHGVAGRGKRGYQRQNPGHRRTIHSNKCNKYFNRDSVPFAGAAAAPSINGGESGI